MKIKLDVDTVEMLNFICQEAANRRIKAIFQIQEEAKKSQEIELETISNLFGLLVDLLGICNFWKTIIVFEADLKDREEMNKVTDFWIEYCTNALEKDPMGFSTEQNMKVSLN